MRRVVSKSNKNTVYNTLYYIPVVKTELNEIEVVLKKETGVVADNLKNPVTLVIHFRAYPFYM